MNINRAQRVKRRREDRIMNVYVELLLGFGREGPEVAEAVAAKAQAVRRVDREIAREKKREERGIQYD